MCEAAKAPWKLADPAPVAPLIATASQTNTAVGFAFTVATFGRVVSPCEWCAVSASGSIFSSRPRPPGSGFPNSCAEPYRLHWHAVNTQNTRDEYASNSHRKPQSSSRYTICLVAMRHVDEFASIGYPQLPTNRACVRTYCRDAELEVPCDLRVRRFLP
jgi:hypothetical protein